ncbi:MAG: methyltransferase domain-containing protein [Methanoregula sp.]|nr:methyltransferase domain-containing protein [Methanoregula sp.]
MKPALQHFDRYAEDYDRWFDTHPELYGEQLSVLRSLLPYRGRGLEIGVGSGRFAAPLGIAYGLDPSVPLLSRAFSRGIEPVQGIGEFLPCRADIFDYVLMMTVICFMEDLVHPFREAYRVLRPGGTLVIGFIETGGELALQERDRSTPSRFLHYAGFKSTREVMTTLAMERFSEISLKGNLHGLFFVTGQKE